MAINISWLVEEHIVYWKSTGVDTDVEFEEAVQKVLNLFDESSAPLVHVIVDFSAIEQHATIDLKQDQAIPKHPKNGWNIFVAAQDPLLKMHLSIKVSQLKARLRWFPTMEEAIEFLPSVDSTLPDLSLLLETIENSSS